MNLAQFQRPSRYINNEVNSIHRHLPSSRDSIRVALCFPDVYEIGMSHLGLRILYDIINSQPFCNAERCFSPWPDYADYLRSRGIPLTSLEAGRPLSEFDVLGFSLQYEMSYTTVLSMLSLGGVPHRSEDRLHRGKAYPLIVGGGPCTCNPLPMAPFIDAFLLGDGEDAVCDLLSVIKRWKREGDGDRMSLLRGIAALEGFYVPVIHGATTAVRRRVVTDLTSAPYPVQPIVPYTTIVHDRVTIEVSRGCPMGCRFCQAGMIYRPYRWRDPERVLDIARQSVCRTGYEEVSFSSLSAGDYPCLLSVITEFNKLFADSRTAVSLPSLRVGTISRDVLKAIKSVRKTGFTIAPEAGSERLRSVINKDFTDEDFERAVATLFEEDWQHLKLYYMVGLPTESDEDVTAIRGMVQNALSLARRTRATTAHITVSVSPFIPKPHTPFQWSGQVGIEEMKRKIGLLRKILPRGKVTFKSHDPEMSCLEALFARGEFRHGRLIEEAWSRGCRLDGWTDQFDFRKWLDAMDRTGIDGLSDARRTLATDTTLPWEIMDIGISREFLLREHQKSLAFERTPSCLRRCSTCGIGCATLDVGPNRQALIAEFQSRVNASPPPETQPRRPDTCIRVRVRFSKQGHLRYLSHLEVTNVLLRAMRRQKIPLDYSKGFHPLPRVSFGPPLGVGVAGQREYFDMHVFAPFDSAAYIELMNAVLPQGIRIAAAEPIPWDTPSLTSFITRYDYRCDIEKTAPSVPNGLIYTDRDLFPVEGGLTPKGAPLPQLIVMRNDREVDIAPCIESLAVMNGDRGEGHLQVRMTLRDAGDLKARVAEVTSLLFPGLIENLTVTRSAVYGWLNGWSEPL